MNLSDARTLIEKGIDPAPPQTWADLGAGHGLFTRALAELLSKESVIYAVDKNAHPLKELEQRPHPVTIITLAEDFLDTKLHHLDGIIMANSLHFIPGQGAFLEQVKTMLKPSGRLILVEYDIGRANAWVPYPVSFNTLKELAKNSGWSLRKLTERPSRYQSGSMYSAVLERI